MKNEQNAGATVFSRSNMQLGFSENLRFFSGYKLTKLCSHHHPFSSVAFFQSFVAHDKFNHEILNLLSMYFMV